MHTSRDLELYFVHLREGGTFVKADRAKVGRDGTLTFSIRLPLRWKHFLAFAPQSWCAYHLASAYYRHDSGRYEVVDSRTVSAAVGSGTGAP